jgi:feruloyl esterase
LEHWVEEGIAPNRIIASKVTDGDVVMTRPLCAYPNVAKWDGVGDTDAALSFTCEAP